MNQVFILICFTVSGIVKAEHETEKAILKRLEATERLVQNLFDEVASLKAQDQFQKEQIMDIKKQLYSQQQRNIQLGRLNRRLTASKLKTESLKENGLPVSVRHLHKSDIENDAQIQMNRIKRVENGIQVAFFAKMDKNLEHAGVHQNFVFEVVVANAGNGYNNQTGTFVTPVSGFYVFSTTLVSFAHVNAHAQFTKNGQAVTNMVLNGAQAGLVTTSQTIVLPLLKGDVVTVQNLETDKSFLGGSHSTFSGFLLFDAQSFALGK